MQELKPLRDEIDALDNQIIALLGKRYQVVRRVAGIKEQHNIDVVQPERMEEVFERCAQIGITHNLDPEFIRGLYAYMIEHAHTLEDDLVK